MEKNYKLSPPPTRSLEDIKDNKFSRNWKLWFSLLTKHVNFGDEASPIVKIEEEKGIVVISSLMRIESITTGNVIIIKDPQIYKGKDREEVSLEGSDDIKTVTLENGRGLQLKKGNIVLGDGDVINLRYNIRKELWIEYFRNN